MMTDPVSQIKTPDDVYRSCIPVVADILREAKDLFDHGTFTRKSMLAYGTYIDDTINNQNDGWLDSAKTIKLDFGIAAKIDNILFGVSEDAIRWHHAYPTAEVKEYGIYVCQLM